MIQLQLLLSGTFWQSSAVFVHVGVAGQQWRLVQVGRLRHRRRSCPSCRCSCCRSGSSCCCCSRPYRCSPCSVVVVVVGLLVVVVGRGVGVVLPSGLYSVLVSILNMRCLIFNAADRIVQQANEKEFSFTNRLLKTLRLKKTSKHFVTAFCFIPFERWSLFFCSCLSMHSLILTLRYRYNLARAHFDLLSHWLVQHSGNGHEVRRSVFRYDTVLDGQAVCFVSGRYSVIGRLKFRINVWSKCSKVFVVLLYWCRSNTGKLDKLHKCQNG